MSMTFAEMKVRASLYLQDVAGARWDPTAVIGPFLNDAQRDFARGSKIVKKSATLAVDGTQSPATAFYTAPTDMLELEGVWNASMHLVQTVVDALPWNWDTLQGSPTRYLYGDFGLTLVRLWPYPAAASTTAKAYYTALPADLSGTQTSVIPAVYHLALVYKAVAECYLMDGQFRDPTKGARFLELYQRELADASSRAGRRFNAGSTNVPYRHS